MQRRQYSVSRSRAPAPVAARSQAQFLTHWTVRILQTTAPFKHLPVARASCLCPYIFLQPHPRPVATYSSGVPSVCPTEPKETPKSSYSAKYFLKTLNSDSVMTGNTPNCQNSLNLFPSMDFQSSCWSIATTEECVTTCGHLHLKSGYTWMAMTRVGGHTDRSI